MAELKKFSKTAHMKISKCTRVSSNSPLNQEKMASLASEIRPLTREPAVIYTDPLVTTTENMTKDKCHRSLTL